MPYIFLLLVLEDMGVYSPQVAVEDDVQEVSSGDISLARQILALSFKAGLERFPVPTGINVPQTPSSKSYNVLRVQERLQ